MSREWPTHIGELSTYALDQAIETLSKEAAGISPDVDKALAVIRLVAPRRRAAPWYGQVIDPEDSSVTAGVMMRNAFEAVGDHVDEPPRHWFTRMYLGRWRRGRTEYYDFLEHLTDPVRWEQEAEAAKMTAQQAMEETARVRALLEGTGR